MCNLASMWNGERRYNICITKINMVIGDYDILLIIGQKKLTSSLVLAYIRSCIRVFH